LFLGIGGDNANLIKRTTTGGTVNAIGSGKYTKNYGYSQIPDRKSKDSRQTLENLTQTRGIVWETVRRVSVPDVTDVRLFSIMTVDSGAVGLSISSGIGASPK